ncbi:sugar transferase [Galbibacter pacificus]|uniref:Sugar transferase n=1 Tax=Galbibacter pacificus TaxID=2996052 RepID=A0ABT6FUT3_9FLAO|nr:sugar transferase [Galbibacter pacificus]MDG3583493.1 sugar transferase [Galbibacter pacificus]MDG3587030.1 sugar transferase [Galbibacter pacificus]
MYKSFFKRFLDIMLAAFGLIFLSPVIIVITIILLFVTNGRPFFFQLRPGKDEKIFKLVKFKSMTDKTDTNGELLPYSERITKFGSFIRKYSLDEIPQLFNVLKGDMSLIGPRPLLIKYLPLYNNTQKQRHTVKPGITGWAQINGRNAISWNQKFEYDIHYVNRLNFAMDSKIIYLTMLKVLKKEGVNQQKDIPMEPFNGNN